MNEVTGEQQIEVFSGLYGDERFDDTRGQIRNYCEATVNGISVADVQKIAAFDRAAAKSNPRMKIALVTSGSENDSALAALYDAELYGTPWKVSLFNCVNEAMAWVA